MDQTGEHSRRHPLAPCQNATDSQSSKELAAKIPRWLEIELGHSNSNPGKLGKGTRREISHTGRMGVQEVSQNKIHGDRSYTEITSLPTLKANLDSEGRHQHAFLPTACKHEEKEIIRCHPEWRLGTGHLVGKQIGSGIQSFLKPDGLFEYKNQSN